MEIFRRFAMIVDKRVAIIIFLKKVIYFEFIKQCRMFATLDIK